MAILDFVNFNGARLDLQDSASVHFDAEQELTDAQQTQARENIAAAGQEDLESLEDYVRSLSPLATVGPADMVSIADAAPLTVEGLTVNVEPKQDLHGYDAPWPAGGGKNIGYISAENLVSSQRYSAEYGENSVTITSTGDYGRAGFSIQVKTGQQYTVSYKGKKTGNAYALVFNNVNEFAYIYNVNTLTETLASYSFTFTATSDVLFVGFYPNAQGISITVEDFQVELGSTATSYSPYSNICPITGWEGCEVKDEGKNLLDKSDATITGGNAVWGGTTDTFSGDFILPAGNYVLTCSHNVTGFYVTDSNNAYVHRAYNETTTSFVNPRTQALKINLYISNVTLADMQSYEYQLELGSTATAYEPYKSHTASVSFPETIYGGTVDLVTGECVVDRAMVDLGTLTWGLVSSGSFTPYFKANVSSLGIKYEGGFGTTAYRILSSMYKCVARSSVEFVDKTMCADGSSTNQQVTQIQIKDSAYSDATAFKAAMSGVQLVYELATPTTFTLTPAELELFKGVNNISADAGQVTVTYRQDIYTALNNKINELQAIVVENG